MSSTADEPTSPVPVREKGYANSGSSANGWWNDLVDEPTPELQWPHSVGVFDRMRRQDAQVSSVLRAVTSPIIRTVWQIDGTGCRPEVTAFVAANLGLPIKGVDIDGNEVTGVVLRGRDRFSWNEHLRLALLMLPFGHMFFEQVYRYDDAGMARLRKLGPRLPKSLSKINVARDGGLVSIEQKSTSSVPGVLTAASLRNAGGGIPITRLVGYVLDREGGNWTGISLLRPAYKNWLLKDRALRTWSISIDRNGTGIPLYTAAEKEANLDAGEGLATSVRSGDNAGGAIPYGAKLELLGVTGQLPDIDKFVRYQDEQIARAVLAHFLNLGTQTGSWALGSTFADFFTLSLQAIADELRGTANSHIVEDLVDINYGRTEPAPQIVFDEIGSRADINDSLSLLRKAAGLEDDDALEQFLRQNVAAA
jgi:hypothetical protein